MEAIDKEALRQVIIEQLERERAALEGAAHSAKEEATDGESRQEGQYDMRAQTAAYLAAGQARRTGELADAITAYRLLPLERAEPGKSAALGDLVALDTPSGRTWYFFGPARGGMEVEMGGTLVAVVTAASPLGRALLGSHQGQSIPLPGARAPSALVGAVV